MREQPSIPKWALEHIRDELRPDEEVINAVSFKQGLFSGIVLLNTSRGAAIVAKSLLGDPRRALLTYPRDLLTFRCTACAARNILIDAATGADVHCNHCGEAHRIEATGQVTAQHLGASPAGKKAAHPSAKGPDRKAGKGARTPEKTPPPAPAKAGAPKATGARTRKKATKASGTEARKKATKASGTEVRKKATKGSGTEARKKATKASGTGTRKDPR